MNILIHSQMRFQLYRSHALTVIGLKSGKKNINFCGHFRDLKVTLKLKLQASNFSQTKTTDRSYAYYSLRLSSYRAKYVKNVEKMCLSRMFMGLKHNLNLTMKSLFLAYVTRIY